MHSTFWTAFVTRMAAATVTVLGALLAVSAGALVYVSATLLLPCAEQESNRYSLVALAGGILMAVVIVSSKG